MATFGAMMFPTDYAIQPVELAQAVEARGLDSLFFPEHTHIPTSRKSPWPGGGDLPTEYWHTHDQFVAADGGCGRDQANQARHRDLPRYRARPDRAGEGGRLARRDLERPRHPGNRRRLERRGDGEPRHRFQASLEGAARARPGDEGDLDQGSGRVPRRVRQLRSHVELSEAGANGRTAGAVGLGGEEGAGASGRLLRRMDSDQPQARTVSRRTSSRCARLPIAPGANSSA